MKSSGWKMVWGIMMLLVWVLFNAQPCQAAEHSSKYDIKVPAGEYVEGPFLVAGKDVLVNGVVNGDLYVFGTNVVINGTVTGDLLVVGAIVKLNGNVKGDVRSLSGTIDINGMVDGDVSSLCRQLTVGPMGIVRESLLMLTVHGEIDGSVQKKVCGWGSAINFRGDVGKGVELFNVGRLIFEESARIDGPVRYTSVERADITPGAVLPGNVQWERQKAKEDSGFMILFWFLAGTAVWFVFNVIFPGFWNDLILPALKKPFAAILWGATVFLLIPVLALALLFTLVGIPVALIITGCYITMLYLGKIIAGHTLGKIVVNHFHLANRLKPFTQFLIGYAALVLLGSLPYVGSFTGIIAVFWAMGVVCLAAVTRRRDILAKNS